MTTNIPINMDELKKLSQLILNNVQLQETKTDVVTPPSQNHVVQPDTHVHVPNNVVPVSVPTKLTNSEFYKLAGFEIPPQTLYLFIVLLIIGILIWKSHNSVKQKNKD